MTLEFLDAQSVRNCLPMADCISAVSDAMAAVYQKQVILPQRQFTVLPENNYLAVMPGALFSPAISGAKVVTLYPKNPSLGQPAIQGLIILFDLETGRPIALVDAASVTAIRTAAASAVATRELAREDASTLAILGYGVQALTHLEAMLAVRPIEKVLLWGRSLEAAQAFALKAQEQCEIAVEVVEDVRCAVEPADIICTVTGSPEPVVRGEWLRSGAHLNLVGAHTPATREVDTDTIKNSRLFVEIKEFALKEAGDILIPLKEGEIDEAHIVAEIGEVILSEAPGRQSETEITVYKSLGNTAQDLAAAHAALMSAQRQGETTTLDFKP